VAKISLDYVKTVHAKGKQYLYFDTGDAKARYVRLPDAGSPEFGTRYAAFLGIRKKRQHLKKIITVAELAARYQLSPKFLNRAKATQQTYLRYIIRAVEMFKDWPASDIDRAVEAGREAERSARTREVSAAAERAVLTKTLQTARAAVARLQDGGGAQRGVAAQGGAAAASSATAAAPGGVCQAACGKKAREGTLWDT
jgi:hypothetical protein